MIVNIGPKGPAVAAIKAMTSGRAAFIDDLLPNLDSVAKEAPAVATFQMVADERLRPLALAAPDRHPRIDDWAELGPAIAVGDQALRTVLISFGSLAACRSWRSNSRRSFQTSD